MKIDWNLNYDESTCVSVGNVSFNVYRTIPYEKKMEFVNEYAISSVILNPDGFAYLNPFAEVAFNYCILKYYTDIELNPEGDNRGWIYDWCVQNDMQRIISTICLEDLVEVRRFATKMVEMTIESWKHGHSFAATITNLMSEETLKQLAQSEAVQDELAKTVLKKKNEKAAKDSEGKITKFPEFAKKDK